MLTQDKSFCDDTQSGCHGKAKHAVQATVIIYSEHIFLSSVDADRNCVSENDECWVNNAASDNDSVDMSHTETTTDKQHRPITKSRCQKVRPAKRGMRYARRGMRYADRGMRYAEKAMKVSKADLLKEVWEWRWCTGARLLCTTAATQTPAALRSSAPEASWIWGSLHLWQQG